MVSQELQHAICMQIAWNCNSSSSVYPPKSRSRTDPRSGTGTFAVPYKALDEALCSCWMLILMVLGLICPLLNAHTVIRPITYSYYWCQLTTICRYEFLCSFLCVIKGHEMWASALTRPTTKQQPTPSPQMRADHFKQCRRRIRGRRKAGGWVDALAKRLHKHESHVKSVFGVAWNTVRYNGTVLNTTLKKNVGAQGGSTYVPVRFMLENGVEKVRELCISSVQRGWVPRAGCWLCPLPPPSLPSVDEQSQDAVAADSDAQLSLSLEQTTSRQPTAVYLNSSKRHGKLQSSQSPWPRNMGSS
jgi:hypothetical protein